HADAIVVPARGITGDLARLARVSRDRISVIFNPVDRKKIERLAGEQVEHPWFAPGAPPVLVAVGRLSAEKDYKTLLRALAALRPRRPLRLMILGEGNELEALRALAKALDVADGVLFAGFVPNPFAYMRRAAARFEGMPNSLVQAVVLGCRVVATDCQ
ncbi:glycosyltransferase, partial [bacterium]|nr:glycosyltransferase [bacterium]